MTVNVNGVVRWLRDHRDLSEAEIVDHPDLNELLDPIRSHGPLPFRCNRERCNTTIAYWALTSHDARIAPAPKRRSTQARVAGRYPLPPDVNGAGSRMRMTDPRSSIVGGVADLDFPEGFDHDGRYELAVEWALGGDQSQINVLTNPDVKSPWQLRWVFMCPKCGAEHQYTNRTMLDLFLKAVRYRLSAVRPGRTW